MKLHFTGGNQIDLLNSGREYFPVLLAALQTAREEIFLEAYIFAHDATANAVVERLCAAAQRGVRVHVLVDGFGSRDMPQDYRARLTGARA
jgi:cardiolipin synthase A/B